MMASIGGGDSVGSSSRQHHHDDLPPLPSTTNGGGGSRRGNINNSTSTSGDYDNADGRQQATVTTHPPPVVRPPPPPPPAVFEEEKTGSGGSLNNNNNNKDMVIVSAAAGEDEPPNIRMTVAVAADTTNSNPHSRSHSGASSSVRFSLTTDSNYSSCSSNRSSGFTANRSCCSKSGGGGGSTGGGSRSMELRKVPMDTSLLFGSSNAGGNNKKGDCAKCNKNPTTVAPPHTEMDNSDNTHTEVDEDYEDNIDNYRRRGKKGGLFKEGSLKITSRRVHGGSCARRILRSTCLRSNFSLQLQLLLSFGMVSLLTILLVMCICVGVSIMSGNKVNELTRESLEQLSYQMEGRIVRYVAEALSMRLLPDELVQILHDAAVDRFLGYPNYPGYDNDALTPFRDVYTQQRIYPIKGPTAGLDWDLHNPVTPETAYEHVQNRLQLYQKYEHFTTSQAVYSFQGACNPQAVHGDYDWYPNCTTANNDIKTGGVVHPVTTNEGLFIRSSDLTPLFKAIYEDTPTVRDIGICFANDGAGATTLFPAYTVDSGQHYKSIGCDWMRQPNPYKPSQPIGTEEMIAKCAPVDKVVHNREYNPLERSWCKEQALKPDTLQLIGPFQDAWNNDVQLMLVGKALYDPLTKEFIGCLFLDFTLNDVQETLEKITVTPNSHVSIVRWDEDGNVAASSALRADHKTNPEQHDMKIQDLPIGVDEKVYQRLYNMVDYEEEEWDPKLVRDTYANMIHHDEDEQYLVAAYPMPPVPEEYDPEYRPQWLVIMSVSTEDVLEQAVRLEDYVDDKVESVVYFSLVAGVVGWALVMLVIMVVSEALTLPLKSMNQATKDIVDNFGGNSEKGIAYNAPSNPLLTKCAPETEVSQVNCEFNKMVQKFSGSSKMAKAVQEKYTELANHFSFEHEFEPLYKSRQDGSFAYAYDKPSCGHTKRSLRVHGKSGSHLTHFGTILTGSQSHLNLRKIRKRNPKIDEQSEKAKRLTSPLFLWIVAFIVTPLLITTVTMSAIVTFNVSQELTEVIDDGKAEYVKLEKFALISAVSLRANWIAGKTEKTTRDLHIVSRYASWLLFGGLERRDSFTELTSGTDECKMESNPMECPYVHELPCDCLLDPTHQSCGEGLGGAGEFSSRYLQETYFLCQSHDTMPDGDRLEALSFPDVAFSPATTAWWSNVTAVPGAEKGSLAEGYDTTYDRLRVLSAIPVFQTLYNYHRDNKTVLQSAVAMEADGMVVGYHGCSMVGEAMAAFWESTPRNHANDIRPELCPVGKFGFDPRCREWYDTGKRLADEEDLDLYITGPYPFATDTMMGQTCTSPLVDPRTGEHVGQAFIDYKSKPIYDILSPNNTLLAGGFPILIAARADKNGANTIIGPGFEMGVDDSLPIERVVLQSDLECSEPECERRQQQFQMVLDNMRSGRIGQGAYTIRQDDGSEEQMFVAYAPVNVTTYPSINSSEFSRGVSVQENTIYYIALTEKEATLVAAFDQVEEDINLTIDIGIAILSTAIVVAVAVVIYISYWVAVSITQPMLYLLELIRQINEVDDNDEILVDLDMQAGSKEVKSVANTMGTLHKIVHCANSAYFAGDIDKAYAVLMDSARLFKRLDNKKAVGVANNNLGNTMLAMYRVMRADTSAERFCGLTRREIVLKGLSYFHQAIQLGEKAYDEFYEAEGWSPSCLDFMQHLANRYFNRAMFLLTVKDDHDNPKELEELGMRDLQIARDMDVEIVDQGTEVGWEVNTANKLFKVALNRARGHLLLLEMGYPDEWDLEELLEELFRTMKKEWRTRVHTSDLFQELGPAGRMQQVETELMRYKLLQGDLDTASKIAIRMLMEDEFILPDAQLKAVQVLISVLKRSGSQNHVMGQLAQYESWLQRAKAGCDNNRASSETGPSEDVSEVISMSVAKMNLNLSLEDTSVRLPRNSSLLATTRGDVTMEIF